ncbi:unnamed protein product [Paramecium sonneborni]|uniref:Uncharacterized protein n=1 Tax=Paramecium sonneborni TaxID=65129 RepID=A0A8S1MMV2_9CILI|nr:unnamed protein product [Paramecium sonneborni]
MLMRIIDMEEIQLPQMYFKKGFVYGSFKVSDTLPGLGVLNLKTFYCGALLITLSEGAINRIMIVFRFDRNYITKRKILDQIKLFQIYKTILTILFRFIHQFQIRQIGYSQVFPQFNIISILFVGMNDSADKI